MHGRDQGAAVAFFDFDGTLAQKDSLWPFLVAVRGRLWCYVAAFLGLVVYLATPFAADHRTVMKRTLLRLTLGGLKPADVQRAVEKMKSWPVWIEETVAALKKHHAQGHLVVIATGSLDLYMPALLKTHLPYDELICTRMEVVDGVLTGRMASGNCVRNRKAELVAEFIAQRGPFADSWAYGNAPHDLPMMDLVRHRVVV